MRKKFNSTPFIIVAVIILAVILVVVSNKNLNKPKNDKEIEGEQTPNTEQSLIDEIETIRIENTTDSDLIDIDRELNLL